MKKLFRKLSEFNDYLYERKYPFCDQPENWKYGRIIGIDILGKNFFAIKVDRLDNARYCFVVNLYCCEILKLLRKSPSSDFGVYSLLDCYCLYYESKDGFGIKSIYNEGC